MFRTDTRADRYTDSRATHRNPYAGLTNSNAYSEATDAHPTTSDRNLDTHVHLGNVARGDCWHVAEGDGRWLHPLRR